jgi:hypothetical protein
VIVLLTADRSPTPSHWPQRRSAGKAEQYAEHCRNADPFASRHPRIGRQMLSILAPAYGTKQGGQNWCSQSRRREGLESQSREKGG